MNDFTPTWFVNKKTKEIVYQDSCGDFMIPTKEQLADILNRNDKEISNYLLMIKHQEKIIKKLQESLPAREENESQAKEESPCTILKFPSQTQE